MMGFTTGPIFIVPLWLKCQFYPWSSRAMQSKRLLSFCRTITTFTSKQAITKPLSTLLLDSYCETDSQAYVFSHNRAINDQIKSGFLHSAVKLFEEMPIRDVVTWNLIISGHSRCGLPGQALYLYNQMLSYGIKESSSTFSSVLSMCANAGFYQEGLQVHCRVLLSGFSKNMYVGSSLIDLYLHMGLVDIALWLSNDLPERNLAIWNLVLRGFCELGMSNELLGLYGEMKLEGVQPNGLSLCYLIRGCGNERFLNEGKQLHCCAIKFGWLESNLFVANALVDLYSACGVVIDAKKSFEIISEEDVISWNSIVSVYAENGFPRDALEFFNRMQLWEKRPSVRSFMGFLSLSSSTENLILGRQTHCYLLKLGLDCGSVHVQSALIDMYGKCGQIESSVSIIEGVPERTKECCNSLMTSLLHCNVIEDVVEMFGLMLDEGIGLDEVSFSTTLKALSVSASGSLASCRLVHCCVIKLGFEYDTVVSCSLIDAYSKSGHIELSLQVFEKLSSPNVVCFTSIINGYARNGMGREGLKMLETMIQKGLKPDKVTFLCVLTGCNHSGLLEEGRLVFDSMRIVHGIDPDRQHYSCMVDLLGRAGLLDEAEKLLLQAPIKGDPVLWTSLLRSCRVYQNEGVGRRAVKILMELEPEDPAALLLASCFYSEIGEFEASMHIKEVAMARKMSREIGYSSIEVNGNSYQ
ncbi:putative pentatricopeptide repeat-containing protein At3g05240 [Cornus florida]|uniref:putative pentatricopeptide repeat-containing protein At3g05240 n=1 Tax=Cornus florida TaxID=4283 RepID=UPI00289C6FFF|nr:putative pentatricopeptide repeat-containing protein At3g05240 [Cornus florida]